ncbi:MAG TPA: tRNA (N6-isopentenyl adenosine(37)-C2)-methylthiotransferase MiaB [Thermoanaerobaculia bacterium]|nr:tRNA (N6-isopentenyl adenosine(37)-C2)-methylthiotransferase MiaB [Thermoanaerobaculia bacterium]
MSSPPTYRVETWGCQMNVLDGERMAGSLEGRGFRAAGEGESASVVILNTCSVREKAEAKVYSALGVLGRRKQESPDLVIGVTGCVAQVAGGEILERAPWVDFVLGTGNVERVGEIVEEVRAERRHVLALELPLDSPVYQFGEIARGSTFQAYVTVIEGCSQFCTFCIVPFTRGRERSRASSEILEELSSLAARGYTEITLLGQTVNAYRDPEEGFGFGELLRRASRVSGIRRLRFITSHPRFLDDSMIDAIAGGENVAPYLHLPAQSGSDRVLYRMKRRYTAAEYLEKVGRVRAALPRIAISSDFIVGFPGETDEDFEATLRLVSEARFSNLFAFRYSARAGTAAARWGKETSVAEELAAERLARVLALQEAIQEEVNESLVGGEFEILVEGAGRDGKIRGRTPCNRITHVDAGSRELKPGEYVRVLITRGLPNSLLAEIAA